MIQLEWANRIRKRLREDAYGMPWEEKDNVMAFIYPILNFAREEEERISQGFEKCKEDHLPKDIETFYGKIPYIPFNSKEEKKVQEDTARMEYELNKSKEMN